MDDGGFLFDGSGVFTDLLKFVFTFWPIWLIGIAVVIIVLLLGRPKKVNKKTNPE